MLTARRSTKVLKGKTGKKPNEYQEAKALWKMKAAKDRRERTFMTQNE